MSVLQIRRTIPYNARKAVAEVRKIEAGKGVTKREDMEKAFQPVLSNHNSVVVAGYGPVEKILISGIEPKESCRCGHGAIRQRQLRLSYSIFRVE